jgi:hypothetical protein
LYSTALTHSRAVRSGNVYGHCYERKRQREFITFLEALEAEIEESIRTIHLVCDNVSTHHGQDVQKWLTLQRYLTKNRWHSPFSVRQQGAVVTLLSPGYQCEDIRNRQAF